MGNKEVQHTNVHEGDQESPIHGDLLDVVLSNVPLIDLVSARRVSKSWDYAVYSSLFHLNKPKPWLVIHSQNTVSLANRTTHTFDPRSDMWIEISESSNSSGISTLRSSGSSTLVYQLSDKGLAFSSDSLHQTWYHVPSPKVWRVDPIVALVGRQVIVAGGVSYFEDDPLIVEMYDMDTSQWSTCQSIPDILKDSTTSTWLSVASNQNTLYVTQKASGITYSFSPITKTWSGPYDLNPDPRVFFSAVEFAGDDLILAGLIGHSENVQSLKLWKIKPDLGEFNQIAEIPIELLDKLKGESWDFSSISLLANNDFIYIYKNSDPSIIITCEFIQGNWKWGSLNNMVWNDKRINDRMIISCTKVGIFDLDFAMKSGKCNFVTKTRNL